MKSQLTHQQHAELEQHGDKPMPVLDPVDQKVYFLVAGDLFERFRALFHDDTFDVRETYEAQDAALAKVWDDPALDDYNDYERNKPRP